jgi:hypothetical protein
VGRQTEVFFGYATPVELDWHATFDHVERTDRRQRITEALAALPDNARTRSYRESFPFGLWERWRKRYAWYPVFENVTTPPYLFPVDYWNAEKEDIPLPESAPVEGGRPAPRELGFEYVDPKDRQITLALAGFDEDEVLSAFERLGGHGEPLQLVLRSDAASLTPNQIVLRNGTTSIPLEKTKFGLIGSRRYAP